LDSFVGIVLDWSVYFCNRFFSDFDAFHYVSFKN
jgi:hypothetical protein